MKRILKQLTSAGLTATLMIGLTAMTGLSGCESDKETILDVETPNTDIEVQKSKSDGSYELDIEKDADHDR